MRDESTLAAWLAGPGPAPSSRLADEPIGGGRSGDHDYLFGRPGDPAPLRPWVGSRALLIGLFSGVTLAAGLALLRRPPPGRLAIPIGAAAILSAVAAVEPNLALLSVQSSAVGLILVVLSALTGRLVDRRRPAPLFAESASWPPVAPSPSGSARRLAPGEVGSDESTVIRSRAASTAEHVRLEDPDNLTTEPQPSSSRG